MFVLSSLGLLVTHTQLTNWKPLTAPDGSQLNVSYAVTRSKSSDEKGEYTFFRKFLNTTSGPCILKIEFTLSRFVKAPTVIKRTDTLRSGENDSPGDYDKAVSHSDIRVVGVVYASPKICPVCGCGEAHCLAGVDSHLKCVAVKSDDRMNKFRAVRSSFVTDTKTTLDFSHACNIFAGKFVEKLGVNDFVVNSSLGEADGRFMNTNDLSTYLKSGTAQARGWVRIDDIRYAGFLASRGNLVVGIASGSELGQSNGHVVIVDSSSEIGSLQGIKVLQARIAHTTNNTPAWATLPELVSITRAFSETLRLPKVKVYVKARVP